MGKRGPKKGTTWKHARSAWDYYEKFWSRVDLSRDCWEWSASRNAQGYGQFAMNGKTRSAYRVSYEWLVGGIPDGLEIDHLCRNPSCVNPSHLEAVTHTENVRRGVWTLPRGRKTILHLYLWRCRERPPGPLADLARSGVFKKL